MFNFRFHKKNQSVVVTPNETVNQAENSEEEKIVSPQYDSQSSQGEAKNERKMSLNAPSIQSSEKSKKITRCTMGDNVKVSRLVNRMASPIESVESESSDEESVYDQVASNREQKISIELTNYIKKKLKNGSKFEDHSKKYQRSKKEQMNIEEISDHLIKNRISCTKYNYSLDKEVQNFSTYESLIQLSDDGKYLFIFNRKPVPNDLYVLERDPEELRRIKIIEKIIDIEEEKYSLIGKDFNYHKAKKLVESQTKIMDLEELQKYLSQLTIEKKQLEEQKMMREKFLKPNQKKKNKQHKCYHDEDGNEYIETVSKASCYIDDIEGIAFGPVSSRFWLFRKHMNTLDRFDNLPFLTWQCLTLQLKTRDVDLVIKDQDQMNIFLKFLVYHLQTLDTKRDSAAPIIKYLTLTTKNTPEQIREVIANRTMTKYKVIRIRNKISFTAFIKRMTVPQLIFQAILKAHDDLVKEGSIPLYDDMLEQKIQSFEKLLLDTKTASFRKLTKINSVIKQYDTVAIEEEMRYLVKKASPEQVQTDINIDIRDMFNKNTCFDIFKNSMVDGQHIYEPILNRERIQLKIKKQNIFRLYSKIQLVISLKAIDKIMMIKARLKLIELAKKTFILDVQQGQECYIPKELRQDNVPMSYKFYDPIIMIIQDSISEDRKEFFFTKNKINYNHYKDKSFKALLYDKFFGAESSKLTFKYQSVNQKEKGQINHHQSEHTMSLQRSKYIMIDDEVQNIKQKPIQSLNFEGKKGYYAEDEKVQLRFKYCHPRDVNMKRQKQLMFKARFYQKVLNLKSQGKKYEILEKTERWLEQNMDTLMPKSNTTGCESQYHKDQCVFEQTQLQQKLMTYAEKVVSAKFDKMRIKTLYANKNMVNPKVDYQLKNRHVEQGVEDCLRYFDDAQFFLSEELRAQLREVKKQVKKNEEKLKNRNNKKKRRSSVSASMYQQKMIQSFAKSKTLSKSMSTRNK